MQSLGDPEVWLSPGLGSACGHPELGFGAPSTPKHLQGPLHAALCPLTWGLNPTWSLCQGLAAL